MSVDINWEALTGGKDGKALAETIREFIHERFQHIEFPKLIRSVAVHSFHFGSIPPEVVLKDVCQPLPDFYETDGNDDDPEHDQNGEVDGRAPVTSANLKAHSQSRHQPRSQYGSRRPSELEILVDSMATPSLMRGTLGSTGNFGYFNLTGLPGTATPLAAVAGAHFATASTTNESTTPRKTSLDPVPETPTSSSASPTSRPVSREQQQQQQHKDAQRTSSLIAPEHTIPAPEIEPSPEDLQVVFHVTYSGDVHLSLTAEVFLDYPMPSFVGIPLKLNITALTFNGVAILAYIRKRAHLCFLSPEDAEALVGGESAGTLSPGGDDGTGNGRKEARVGALLEEIKIESEMGESGEGKQVLKNVGKIEKFILEQVQKIFEEEFVYPSFWTFLV